MDSPGEHPAKRFVLLDRDGTIILERNYLGDPAGVELIPGAAAGLQRLADAGFGLIVITNQSGVARGYFDLAAVDAVHRRLEELLAAEGVRVEGIYFCPHGPDDGCPCRKPQPGLAYKAATDHRFALGDGIVVGDNVGDILLGQGIGAGTVLVRTGHGARVEAEGTVRPDHIVRDVGAAADLIIEQAARNEGGGRKG